ncbi:MAG: IS4 family transposase [Methylacidiphilales bacterium]|nr:IS4 family transposase [Candidatus Methylacidiphilales bacterium]
MHTGQIVFAQLMEHVPHYSFQRIVRRYNGERRMREFSCWDQFVCMAFGQLTFRESLRDLEVCLRSRPENLYHMGIRGRVSRSTLADANERRDWRIYAEIATVLIRRARKLYAQDNFAVELEATAYALDASTIDLCLSLFPWARFRTTKAAIKVNTLLDLRGSIPSLISITEGKRHEVNWLDDLIFEAGSFYIMDRGYLDFKRLHRIGQAGAFFVIRAKERMRFCRLYSHPINTASGVRCDQTISLTGQYSAIDYPDKLRRIRFYDTEQKRALVFLTNNFTLPADTIATLYKCRWQIELFFKWIKGNLHIKRFLGNSLNAVKTQIWIAVCVYVLVAIVKKQLKIDLSLHSILQILSLNAFQQEPLYELLMKNYHKFEPIYDSNQLSFKHF